MGKIDLIEEDLWDHYSGLPNPLWYQYKKQLEDEENTNDSTNDTIIISDKFQEIIDELIIKKYR